MSKKSKKTSMKKKSLFDKIKSGLGNMCVIYTAIMTVICIFGNIIMQTKAGIPVGLIWMVLGMSFVLAVAEKFLDFVGSLAIGLVGHFAISFSGFYLLLSLGKTSYFANSFRGGIMLFVILYAVIMSARYGVRALFLLRKRNSEEYREVFNK